MNPIPTFDPLTIEFSYLDRLHYEALNPHRAQFAECKVCGIRARVFSVVDSETQRREPFMFYDHNAPCGTPCARSQNMRHIDTSHNAVECPKCGVLDPAVKLEIEHRKTLYVETKP